MRFLLSAMMGVCFGSALVMLWPRRAREQTLRRKAIDAKLDQYLRDQGVR